MILKNSVDGYFSKGGLKTEDEWIINPYLFEMDILHDNNNLIDNLIELRSNRELRLSFDKIKLKEFSNR